MSDAQPETPGPQGESPDGALDGGLVDPAEAEGAEERREAVEEPAKLIASAPW